jgi:hypothetical protein
MAVMRETTVERERMVAGQIAARGVKYPLVLDAMRAAPRGHARGHEVLPAGFDARRGQG